MKIIKPSFEIMDELNGQTILQKIERCGRVCYKSENKITAYSATHFVSRIIVSGHESVLEHVSFTCKFIVDRGVSHEIVRHRLASFSQESTRYVAYKDDIEVIEPCYLQKGTTTYAWWYNACEAAEKAYHGMLEKGCSPQEARAVLPNSLKTELIISANLREWRHILKLRTSKAAHPQIREVMIPLLHELQERVPVVFDDIEVECNEYE